MIIRERPMSGTNDVKEDFLDEDNEIPGQRYVLLSFLSPEKVLARKDLFFFDPHKRLCYYPLARLA